MGFAACPSPVYHRTWLDRSSATYFCIEGRCPLTLLIREEDVRALLTPARAVELVETVFRYEAEGRAENRPRIRIPFPKGLFHSMSAVVTAANSVGLKAYASGSTGATFVVLLFDTQSSALLAILEADWLGRMRTGAASGVATRYMASEAARTLGVIGSGRQAETQIDSIAAVRPLDHIKVFSRSVERREALARSMSGRLDVNVSAVSTAQEAVSESDIVVTITSSREPVVDGSWLANGCHVNAAGSNQPTRRELDASAVARAGIVAVDSLQQARIESGDLILAAAEGAFDWPNAVELSQIVSGSVKPDRSPGGISIFVSQGIAIEDIMVARDVYDRAVAAGRGQRIEFG